MSDRFIVTELRGWQPGVGGGGKKVPLGLSCQVLDTAFNFKLMQIFRSEDENPRGRGAVALPHDWKLLQTRRKAREYCEALNEWFGGTPGA